MLPCADLTLRTPAMGCEKRGCAVRAEHGIDLLDAEQVEDALLGGVEQIFLRVLFSFRMCH